MVCLVTSPLAPGSRPVRIGVFGAGSIGCLIGGRLAHGGADVVLLGRQRLADAVTAQGLTVTDYTGAALTIPPSQIDVTTEPHGLAGCDVVFVTTKSRDTAAAGAALATIIPPHCVIVSLQNGVRNPDMLREQLPGHTVLAGMVPFNVRWAEDSTFHQGTSGHLEIESHQAGANLVDLFAKVGIAAELNRKITGVAWGKLIVNLNNAVNALSGLPLRQQMAQRGYRKVMIAAMREGLAVLKGAGIEIESSGGLPVRFIPYLLGVPDWLFKPLVPVIVKVDDQARSSMWEDFERGRPTEVDFLNGEIVRVAQQTGQAAPVNAGLVDLVKRRERGDGPEAYSADALQAALDI